MQRVEGHYHARLAKTDADVMACQALRQQCFFLRPGRDADRFDAVSRHLMVLDQDGHLRATLRFRIAKGANILAGYVGQFYDLSSIASGDGVALEIGRMCVDPALCDPQALRITWGALTRIADAAEVTLIFGCSSFEGIDPRPHAKSFARLALRYQAPAPFGSFHKSARDKVSLSVAPSDAPQRPMPALLRTYLAMGGWVSDHAVLDREMQTMHVLTGLETAGVPAHRAAALRHLAAEIRFEVAPAFTLSAAG